MKNAIIPYVLWFIFILTIYNLFYKPHWTYWWRNRQDKQSSDQSINHLLRDPINMRLCMKRGYKCPTPENCNCKEICPNTEKFTVLKNEEMYMFEEKMEPGTYCLPKGIVQCNQKTTIPMFLSNGWFCTPRNKTIFYGNHMVACKHPNAKDNNLNVLVDRLTGKMAEGIIENYYEKLSDGTLRYQCSCESLDTNGNRMINILPFKCAVDYCLDGMPNFPALGWNKEKGICECGPYPHKDPSDLTSPCIRNESWIDSTHHFMQGIVECMDTKSLEYKPILCDELGSILHFRTRVHNGKDHLDFVKFHRDGAPTIPTAEEMEEEE